MVNDVKNNAKKKVVKKTVKKKPNKTVEKKVVKKRTPDKAVVKKVVETQEFKNEYKPVKINWLYPVLSLLVIVLLGFLIYGLAYMGDDTNDTNDVNMDYGNLAVDTVYVDYNDTVSVHYELKVDGEVRDSSYDRNEPFEFTVGKGVVEGFSEGVIGMEVGETRLIAVEPEKGYGVAEVDQNMDMTKLLEVANAQGNDLNAETMVKGKAQFTTMMGYSCYVNGYDENTDTALMKCQNPHPLAGKVLNFKIEMLEIEKEE